MSPVRSLGSLHTTGKVVSCRLAELQAFDESILYRTEPSSGRLPFRTVPGRIPVLLSAPHACMHIRDGVEKMEEEFTAAIALLLAERTGAHALVTDRFNREDPNWLPGGLYKDTLGTVVRQESVALVIDLHGMTNRYGASVALGTMKGRACDVASVLPAFESAGFRSISEPELTTSQRHNWRNLVVDHSRFTGGLRSHTVTRFCCEQLGVSAVQVELASRARVVYSPRTAQWPVDYSGEPEAILAVLDALQQLIVDHAQ